VGPSVKKRPGRRNGCNNCSPQVPPKFRGATRRLRNRASPRPTTTIRQQSTRPHVISKNPFDQTGSACHRSIDRDPISGKGRSYPPVAGGRSDRVRQTGVWSATRGGSGSSRLSREIRVRIASGETSVDTRHKAPHAPTLAPPPSVLVGGRKYSVEISTRHAPVAGTRSGE